jgi:hypothetical protein
MFDFKDAQKQLIESLQTKFGIPTPVDEPKITQTFRSGLQSLDDQMKIMLNYVCECGTKMTNSEHSTYTVGNGQFSDDSYKMDCSNCGKLEVINFRMMTRFIKSEQVPNEKDQYMKAHRKYGHY